MNFRQLYNTDYKSVTLIHQTAFDGFFLTTLGIGFLHAYYKASINHPESISVCAIDDNEEMQGFGIGCINSKGYYKRLLLNNFLSFSIQGIIILFSNPKSLIRLFKNMEKNHNENDDGRYAELLSIAVSPVVKGTGLGKELIIHFENEALKHGCKRIVLTTDYINNQNVLSFYEKSGYSVFYEFTTFPNRRMYKLIKDLV